MFTNTFDKPIIEQFNRRATYSALNTNIYEQLTSQEIDDYHDWLGRTPFVLAYSNLRYTQSGIDGIYQNMKYSVLGSIHFTKDNNLINLLNKHSFTDYYEDAYAQDFGYFPKPIIKSLQISGRGKNGTLKDIILVIECYNFQQFYNVKNYFAIPCTSIFMQFGNYVHKRDIQTMLFAPIQSNGMQETLGKGIKNSYLQAKNVFDIYDESVNMDCITGIVYGFDVTQQGGTKFVLTVKMLTKGVSQILNYVKPIYSSRVNETGSIVHNNSLVTEMTKWAAYPQFKNESEVMILNSDKDIYVTYNWITHLPILSMRQEANKQFSGSKDVPWVPSLQKPIFMFQPQIGFNAELVSSNKNIYIKNSKNNVPDNKANSFYTNPDEIKSKQNFYLENSFSLILPRYNGQGKIPEKDSYMKEFDNIYNVQFKKYQENESKDFGWLGNVYIRLDSLKQIFQAAQKITIDSLITSINNMIMEAFSGYFTIGFSFNYRKQIFQIQQHTLHYALSKNVYYIPNFGYNSIVKNVQYSFKMPDPYKMSIFSAYGANGGQMNSIFKKIFGEDKAPKDILLFKGIPQLSVGSQPVLIDWEKDKNNAKSAIEKIFDSSGKYILNQLQPQSIKQLISKYNQAVIQIQKQNIKKINGSGGISSIYATEVELTFDFIANIDWGQVFKLNFNPLGWQSIFFVNHVKYRVDDSGAETIINGFMFG